MQACERRRKHIMEGRGGGGAYLGSAFIDGESKQGIRVIDCLLTYQQSMVLVELYEVIFPTCHVPTFSIDFDRL
jgi:hypothetical protein